MPCSRAQTESWPIALGVHSSWFSIPFHCTAVLLYMSRPGRDGPEEVALLLLEDDDAFAPKDNEDGDTRTRS